MATGSLAWYDVLQAARKVASDGILTSVDLASKTGMGTTLSSAWLSKFVRWGYCTLEGSKAGNKRWLRIFRITKWGMDYKPGKKFGRIKRTDGTLK